MKQEWGWLECRSKQGKLISQWAEWGLLGLYHLERWCRFKQFRIKLDYPGGVRIKPECWILAPSPGLPHSPAYPPSFPDLPPQTPTPVANHQCELVPPHGTEAGSGLHGLLASVYWFSWLWRGGRKCLISHLWHSSAQRLAISSARDSHWPTAIWGLHSET